MDSFIITVSGNKVLAFHCLIQFSLGHPFHPIHTDSFYFAKNHCFNFLLEDPTALFSYPRACPDSVLKFLTDIFSSRDTAGFFYTSDMMILIEIVLRQLTDLSPGAGVSIK